MTTFHIISLFPESFKSYFSASILKRAQDKKFIKIKITNPRDFSENKYKKVDDRPYGGGAGMVLMAEPILRAVQPIKPKRGDKSKIVVFSAKGRQFNQKMAYDWSRKFNRLVLISGRYEGIDERVKKILKAEEICIGPYVLTDGDVAAMVAVSAVTRLLPGVINWESLEEESFFDFLVKKEKNAAEGEKLEYPHYTRPEILKWPPPKRGKKSRKYRVPKILLSGNHKEISKWRAKYGKIT